MSDDPPRSASARTGQEACEDHSHFSSSLVSRAARPVRHDGQEKRPVSAPSLKEMNKEPRKLGKRRKAGAVSTCEGHREVNTGLIFARNVGPLCQSRNRKTPENPSQPLKRYRSTEDRARPRLEMKPVLMRDAPALAVQPQFKPPFFGRRRRSGPGPRSCKKDARRSASRKREREKMWIEYGRNLRLGRPSEKAAGLRV
ncbi:hypothetical protein SKAU_G00310080 [Synaphobranchus kaupii]|uniref:Uncharacterized protein n=1 Tax=Synaphobranchus kaupii TaxID=118154 RepID=A0A9Q1ERP1_SYNKA|nr:hypothetical protein SKAU_G00310080 [Synaphobranchus kaupii]